MLPMQVIAGSIGTAVSIEVKSGECFNGYVVKGDYFMNFLLRDVTITSAKGDQFWKVDQCYVRGNSVKNVRVAEEALINVARNKESAKRGKVNYRGRGVGRGK